MKFSLALPFLLLSIVAMTSCTFSDDEKISMKASAQATPQAVELGKKLFSDQACKTCHSVDGSPLIGPTFKGLFSSKVELASGASVIADEAYLAESMLLPNAKIVKGFPPVMPSYKGRLTDAEIHAIVEYIKTLK